MPAVFEEHMFDSAARGLRRLPVEQRSDTYVISFFVYDEEDDPRRPTLTVGTNSETQVLSALAPPDESKKPNLWWSAPSSEAEARWNYAFWLQNRLATIADSSSDPQGAALRKRWMRSDGRLLRGLLHREAVTVAFVQACVATSQRLHASGVVNDVFGRCIPIVVHELEYYDEIARQTTEANPPGVADGFVAWVNSM